MTVTPHGHTPHGEGKALVLQATDIVQLIGQTVSLKRRGKDYVGLCPFHQEKTPSFHVSPGKQFFHCYGCKEGGNAIDFVIKRDRIEFKEALQVLADRAGITLPKRGVSAPAGERQLLLEANSAACSLFEKYLSDPELGKPARDYLEERGFEPATIKKFQIGLAIDSWDALLKSPLVKKFPASLLQQAGLVKARESGGHYDTFRNRLMFPIRDENARIIGFGGRVMPGSEDPAKYLNSPETPLFSKGRCIYGLDHARQKIVETQTVAVVEGYTDVVMAHQFGAANVVSILGTAMTEQHVAILRRFAEKIVLLFDADSAGETAMNRAVELFLTQPVEIAIASIPEELDPDEYLLKHGAAEFQKLLDSASDALEFRWKRLSRGFEESGSLTARQRAVSEYMELLSQAKGSGPVDTIRWGTALSRVSRLTEIPVDELHRKFKTRPGVRRAGAAPAVPAPGRAAPQVPVARVTAEEGVLAVLLVEPARWNLVQQHLQPVDFTDESRRRIAEAYWDHQRDEGAPMFAEFLDLLTAAEDKQLAMRLVSRIEEQLPDDSTRPQRVEELLDMWLGYFADERERHDTRQTVAQLRRTTDRAAAEVDEVELLKKLQQQAKKPDLRRI